MESNDNPNWQEVAIMALFTLQLTGGLAVVGWTVSGLYQMSGSWHSLWALLMLCFLPLRLRTGKAAENAKK
jgi:hypothetical protein